MTDKNKRAKYDKAIMFFVDKERADRMEKLRKEHEYSYSEQIRRGLDLFHKQKKA